MAAASPLHRAAAQHEVKRAAANPGPHPHPHPHSHPTLSLSLSLSLIRYNVLLLDSDSMVLADPYPLVRRHLQGYTALCLHDITARQHGQSANGAIPMAKVLRLGSCTSSVCAWQESGSATGAPAMASQPPHSCSSYSPPHCISLRSTIQARPLMTVNGGTWYVRGASPEGPVQRVFASAFERALQARSCFCTHISHVHMHVHVHVQHLTCIVLVVGICIGPLALRHWYWDIGIGAFVEMLAHWYWSIGTGCAAGA